MKKLIIILLLSISLIANDSNATKLTDEELKTRVFYTNIAGAGLVTLWGSVFWEYFTTAPKMGDEGWFEDDTKYGGADKIGHLYSTYLWSLGFSELYQSWGMSREDGAFYGATTSWIFQGMMEVGDSFSESQGFSYEDFLGNTIGAGFYYLREKYPSIKQRVDLRLEYIPNFKGEEDIFTLYNSMKYLVAFKLNGFDSTKNTFLKYGEFHIGYYTRGYQDYKNYEQKERVIYAAIGINISEILSSNGWKKTSKIFNYYQLPYTYVAFGRDVDSDSYVAPYSRPYYGYQK